MSSQGVFIGPQKWWADKNLRSLRFNSADSAYLSRTPASAGNRTTWTWAGWVKRSDVTSNDRQGLFSAYGTGNDTDYFIFGLAGATDSCKLFWTQWTVEATSTAVFRDPSAWYHIVANYNGSNLTFYVNNVQVLQSAKTGNLAINGSFAHSIGRNSDGTKYFSGYLADIHFIDGQALEPTAFGEFDQNGIWQPKTYFGDYGTNGFRLNFGDNTSTSTLGLDSSGKGNHWTANNLSVTAGAGNDSMVDYPVHYGVDTGVGGEVRGNYCTLNPLFLPAGGTLSNGNLEATLQGATSTNNRDWAAGTIANSSGKWYYETVVDSFSGGNGVARFRAGIVNPTTVTNDFRFETVLYQGSGDIAENNVDIDTGLPTLNVGDVVGIAYDLDSLNFYVYINGVLEGSVAISNVSPPFAPIVGNSDGLVSTGVCTVNFGQRPFAFTAPAGFKALNTASLPAPTIEDPSTVMDVALYTGTGSSQAITGLEFSPDFVWIKSRSAAASHRLFDQIRGAGKVLYSNATDPEDTDIQTLSQFNSDGFDVGTNTGVNTLNDAYVAWTWDAGSSTVTNNDGSITSSVRANPSAGFSIVEWTGTGSNATVGHGLGVAPQFIIIKSKTSLAWTIYHSAIGAGSRLKFNTDALQTSSTYWNNTAPTSTVFSVGTSVAENSSGTERITYCFAPVDGYSSFGSYTGNGSADGPFVYTGQRSRWILLKNASSAGSNWYLFDTARDTYNVAVTYLLPNSSAAESTATFIDICSNGFKVRNAGGDTNGNGNTIVYACFAENPFQYARAR
jgi:hypothetical protein